jgi:hypothetical protein
VFGQVPCDKGGTLPVRAAHDGEDGQLRRLGGYAVWLGRCKVGFLGTTEVRADVVTGQCRRWVVGLCGCVQAATKQWPGHRRSCMPRLQNGSGSVMAVVAIGQEDHQRVKAKACVSGGARLVAAARARGSRRARVCLVCACG